MNRPDSFTISAIAVNSPVGNTLEHTAAAIRAGVSGLREYDGFHPASDESGSEPVNAGFIQSVVGNGVERLISLVEKPLGSVIQQAGFTRADMQSGDLLMSLPISHSATNGLKLKSTLSEKLPEVFGLPKFRHITGIEHGQSGTIHLIARACKAIMDEEIEFAIVVSVDSFLVGMRLNEYDKAWRIKSARCPTGFSPGEAAAVFLIERSGSAAKRSLKPRLIIDRTGFSKEDNPLTGDKSSTGRGLGEALLKAHGGVQKKISWMFSDLNGENYPSFEWGLVRVRHNELFEDSMEHMHTADVTGHLGAATTAVQLAYVAEAFRKGYAIDSSALLFATNDSGRRAALKISKPV